MESFFVATEKKITMDKFFSQVKIVPVGSLKKVLNASAKVCVVSSECQNGVISISGKVTAEIIYTNSENQICRAENSVDFIEKQRAEFSVSELVIDDSVAIDSVNFMGSDVVCVVSHIVKGCGVYSYEIPKISEDEAFVYNKKQLNLNKLICTAEDNFVVSENIENNFAECEILKSNASANVSSYQILNDKLVLEGKVFVETLILKEGDIDSIIEEFDFKQEISAENARSEMLANVNLFVKNIMVTPESNGDNITLVYVVDIYSKNYIYEETSYEFVTDMFSLKNELQPTYDYIEVKNISSSKHSIESVLLQTDVSALNDFEDVLCVDDTNVELISSVCYENKVVLTINVNALVYFKTLEGIDSFKVNQQSSIEFSKEEFELFDSAKLSAVPSSFKVKAGKDLEVVYKVCYDAKLVKISSEKFVKLFEIKQDKKVYDFGIKVYVAKQGQTIFDVAKILNVTPEIINSQNQVEDVFEHGQKIYVYSPVNLI